MSKYENFVNWKLPAGLRQAIRVEAAMQNKKQQTLGIEILCEALLGKINAEDQSASNDSKKDQRRWSQDIIDKTK